jgi:hypothetical protein
MARVTLTDRFIKSDHRVPAKGRKDYPDALVPGQALRVTEAGHKSFVLVARYPMNPKNPTRRAIGDYGEVTLDQARDTARDWLGLIKKGVDPKLRAAVERAEQLRKQNNSFSAVAAEFLERQALGWARFKDAKHTIHGAVAAEGSNREA